jgi:hypothetical protein
MDRMDECFRRWPFQVSEALKKCLNCFRRPFLDIVFDKGVNELVPPPHTFHIQCTIVERPQRWELPKLREGWKTIKPGVIELSIESLDFAMAQYAGFLNFHAFTMVLDPSQICFYLGSKVLEVCGYI